MLSVASVRSAGGAATYFAKDDFAKDNYYTSENGTNGSEWGGKLADELGLSGEVTKEKFEQLLNGIRPDTGEGVGQVEKRQAGVDLTFSMPKSASVLAYVSGDERILAAHMKAVRATMAQVEKQHAEGRVYDKSKHGDAVKTGNLVYALFQHDTSRALDPQGHIHVVIANMTKMPDGSLKALHNGELWKNNSAIGSVYHAQFRAELAKLGYETRVTGKHGQFEIKGVPDKVTAEFSQRRADILAKANAEGITSPERLRNVTKNTRDPKLTVEDRGALRQSWVDRAAALGFDGKGLVDAAKARAGIEDHAKPAGIARLTATMESVRDLLGSLAKPNDPLVDRGIERLRLTPDAARTQQAVASAVRILEQREAAFEVPKLQKAALDLGLAGVTVEGVDKRISQLVRDGRLLPGNDGRVDNAMSHVMTPDSLKTEERILAGVDAGRGQGAAMVAPDVAGERLKAAAGDKPLNPGQLAAATLAIASDDRIVAVQGIAGAGKSTMLAAVARVAEGEGRKVIGLAFQNKMVGDLREGAGIEARTISSFVNQHIKGAIAGSGERYQASRAALRGTVLFVDESSMVSNDQMERLVRIANAFEVDRLVLVGDRQQLAAIDAGKAFSLVQANEIGMARMEENLRQRTDQLRSVAALANQGKARDALKVLGDKVVVTQDRVGDAAKHWLGLSPAERETTHVFASGRDTRADLNRRIQEGLRAEGTLTGPVLETNALSRVNLTREELRYPDSYRVGQVLDVVRDTNGLPLKRGHYDVLGVDAKGKVTVRDALGREKTFDPAKIDPKDKRDGMQLAEREKLELQAGDKIRWTANDKDRELYNAATARILEVGQDGIKVETASNQVLELKHGDKMLDQMGLAYALNMHMAQGVTADAGIAVMGAGERNLSNQRLFNVTVTRVRDELTLYTDDKDRLGTAIERNAGNKASALEMAGRTDVDGRATSGPAPKEPFDPKLPADLAKGPEVSGMTLDLVGDSNKIFGPAPEPKAPSLPVPEKQLGLEL